ncbi:MAG: hypothetical protein KGM43_00255 [Planctomycetota bacterium]|nr:hypothetical protein [Planctomycetota bacterium]
MRARNSLLLSCLSLVLTAASSRADEPIPLKILYAGHPGTPRERDFATFLKRHFAQVETADFRTFDEPQAQGRDVVILDWTSTTPRDQAGNELSLYKVGVDAWSKEQEKLLPIAERILSDNYARPTLLIGELSGWFGREHKLKIGFDRQSLDDAAHGVVLSHPIFHTPLQVGPQFEVFPTPTEYSKQRGEDFGATILAWRVQTKRYPELDLGAVADADGFHDSPDAEIIARGLNKEDPRSAAISRHANFMQWGFSASPSNLTPSAQKCLVNSICYVKRFDGTPPLTRKTTFATTRAGLVDKIKFTQRLLNDHEWMQSTTLAAVRDDPERIASITKLYISEIQDFFTNDVVMKCGEDLNAYLRWLQANLDRVVVVDPDDFPLKFMLDDDLRVVGATSNHDIALLERCVKLLEIEERTETAARLLKRYTAVEFHDAKGWRGWLDAHKSHLFFDETGRFKFIAAPANLVPRHGAPRPLVNDNAPLDADHPVVVRADFEPRDVAQGGTSTLHVRVATAPQWSIAAGAGISPSLTVNLPQEFEPIGEWSKPEPVVSADGALVYSNVLDYSRKVRVQRAAPPDFTRVVCRFHYTLCNPRSRRPPADEQVIAYVEVVRPIVPRPLADPPRPAADASKK